MKVPKEDKKLAIIKFFLPFAIAALTAAIILILKGDWYKIGGLMLTYLFTPFGKSLILATIALGIRVWEIVLTLLFVDMLEAMFIIWNFDLAQKIPFIGRLIVKAEKKAHKSLKEKSWLERWAYVGVALFVAIPFLGTGPIIGSIVGKILGLKSLPIWIAVIIGSLIASAIPLAVYFGLIQFSNSTGIIIPYIVG